MQTISVDTIRELAQAEEQAYQVYAASLPDSDTPQEELDQLDPLDLAPGAEYWGPLEAWLEAFDAEIFPLAAPAMKALASRYQLFEASGEASPDAEFWKLRGQAQEMCQRRPPVLHPKPTVQELHAQKVSELQIARIWELKTPGGHEDIAAVQQELEEPGSIITPEYIAQLDAKRLAEEGWGPSPKAIKTKRPEAKVPPNLCALVQQRVSVEQIADIVCAHYGRTDQESFTLVQNSARAIAIVLGIDLPPNAQAELNAAGKDLNERRHGKAVAERQLPTVPVMEQGEFETDASGDTEQTDQPDDSGSSLEAEVILMHEAGHLAPAIARELNISKRRVNRIIAMNSAG